MSDINFVAVGVAALIGFLFGIAFAGNALCDEVETHRQIVKRTSAYYHPETGKFTWGD